MLLGTLFSIVFESVWMYHWRNIWWKNARPLSSDSIET